MTTAFKGLVVADARITEVVIRDDVALVRLRDWRERAWVLTFGDVTSVEEFGAVNVDLSHIEESIRDPLTDKARQQTDDQFGSGHCFAFVSAWTDEPVLRVVASRVDVAVVGRVRAALDALLGWAASRGHCNVTVR